MNKNYISIVSTFNAFFICTLASLVIYNLEFIHFDDFSNYKNIYDSISDLPLYKLHTVYREQGLVYIFAPLAYLGLDFKLALKINFVFFSIGTLIIMLFFSERRLKIVMLLTLFAFFITNRQYIEGAFNYTRSWIAIHWFAWSLFVFHGKQLRNIRLLLSVLFLFISFITHAQSTILMLAMIFLPLTINKVISNRILKYLILIVVYSVVFLVIKNSALVEIIEQFSTNTQVLENNSLSLSLFYQTVFPFLVIVLMASVSSVKSRGLSSKRHDLIQLYLISIGLFFILFLFVIPLAIRFSCLFLLVVTLFQCRLLSPSSIVLITINCITLLNVIQLFNSSLWTVL